jgi:LCP family protein required for cell wall assembly
MLNFKKFFKIVGISIGVFLLIIIIGIVAYLNLNKGATITDLIRGVTNNIPIDDKYKSRVNILVVGLDNDQVRTDVDMVLSFSPKSNKASVFQLPRDTRIKFDETDRQNLATLGTVKMSNVPHHAMKLTEAYSYGGINLTKYAASKLLNNISINYVIQINLKAFRNIVNEVDGVDINVPQDMNYDDSSQNLHIHLKKGYQHLDGDKAEQFVRFRHYAMGDLQRIEAQRDFLTKLSKKIMSTNGVLHAVPILRNMTEYTKNDLETSAITSYALEAINLKSNDIKFYSILGYAPPASQTGGISYFVCDQDKTNALVQKVFDETDQGSSQDTAVNSSDDTGNTEIDNSKIKIEVLNSTSISGLAKRVAEKLEADGFKISYVGNWGKSEYEVTQIINNNKTKNGTNNVKKALNAGEIADSNDSASDNNSADVIVVVGKDLADIK